jgi:Serine endopeptidase inhibitors.
MNQQELQQPFFARFLETLSTLEQTQNNSQKDPWPLPVPTSPLKDAFTDKWPSDWDEI